MSIKEKEVLEELQKMKDWGDPEIAHRRADLALTTFLRGLGYNEICDAFSDIEKWYS